MLFPRSKLVTAATVTPVVAFLVLIVVFLTVPRLREADLLVLAAAGLLAGLPHGAVDLFLELGPGGVPRGRALLGQFVLYLAVVAVMLAVILVAPVFGVALFLLVSGWHFGSSESAFNACRQDRAPSLAPVETVACGAPLTVLPFVVWPEQVRMIIDPLGGPGVTTSLLGPAKVALAVALVAVAVTAVRHVEEGRWVELGELALLWVGAWVLPPLAAFSVYFALWHSPRHIVRTLPQLPTGRADLADGRVLRSLLRYGLYTLPGTIGALALFALLIVLNNGGALRVETWAGALLAALTVPHAVAIFRYDLWLDGSS